MDKGNKGDAQMIARAIADMEEEGVLYRDGGRPNVPELMRRTGLSRQRARTIAAKGFRPAPHGNTGRPGRRALSAEEAAEVCRQLSKGVVNSSVLLRVLRERYGYGGGVSAIKRFRALHMDLVPAPKPAVAQQGPRGRRYETGPGRMFQMDWGFVNVVEPDGSTFRAAVFAMVCHHCGMVYIEFFTNARQENLFIGMVHAFVEMGVPEVVLTDNMASVSNRRGEDGAPIWNACYDAFQKACGFRTVLCRPRHPFTKGKVERLVRFVKENFVPARTFRNLSDLNGQALGWCRLWNSELHRSTGIVPSVEHMSEGLRTVDACDGLEEAMVPYAAPLRKVSFDGFVAYEGRSYGVPFSYTKKAARVMRDGDELTIMDESCSCVVCRHRVDWSRRQQFCEGQFEFQGPEELPTARVASFIERRADVEAPSPLSRFDFRED